MALFNPSLTQQQDPWAYLNMLQTKTAPTAGMPTMQGVKPVKPSIAGPNTMNAETLAAPQLFNPNATNPWDRTPKMPPMPKPGLPPPRDTDKPTGPNLTPGAGAGNSTNPGKAAPTVTPTINNGAVWYPKPEQWVTQQSAYRPIVFPGVETSGNGLTKYADGSVVDYTSAAWKKAASFSPPENGDLWKTLPDSWKAEMAGWDPSFVSSYLDALSNYNVAGTWGGKYMSGAEAAAEIVKLAREAASKTTAANEAKAMPAPPAKNFQRFSPTV